MREFFSRVGEVARSFGSKENTDKKILMGEIDVEINKIKKQLLANQGQAKFIEIHTHPEADDVYNRRAATMVRKGDSFVEDRLRALTGLREKVIEGQIKTVKDLQKELHIVYVKDMSELDDDGIAA